MMKIRAGNRKGQAAVELAIFGTLILISFSVMLTYGQRLELQQKMKMEAFRKAMKKAYQKNSSASYVVKKDTRATSLFSGYGQGQNTAAGASATVMWQKGIAGLKDDSPKGQDASWSYYVINDREIELPRYTKKSIGLDGSKHDVTVPAHVWKEDSERDEDYTSSVKKEESETGTINTASADLNDALTTTLYTRFDSSVDDPRDNVTPAAVYPADKYGSYGPYLQGAYYDSSTNRIVYREGQATNTIHHDKTWKN